jgi:HEAT repeat protein
VTVVARIGHDARNSERSVAARESIVRALRRGVVERRHALRALATLGDPEAVVVALESLSDADRATRREAIRVVADLSRPEKGDGRAVDPAVAVLADPSLPTEEKVGVARLLGRTGAARAEPVLMSMLSSPLSSVRSAVLDALGLLPSASTATDLSLVAILDDPDFELRQHAAIAIARRSRPELLAEILRRLSSASEQDRPALGVAASGLLSRAQGRGVIEEVTRALTTVPEASRDALIEGLGRMESSEAREALERLGHGLPADRRKVAEALGGQRAAEPVLVALLDDVDTAVRANAAWSLGSVAGAAAIDRLRIALEDVDVAVAANAAASLGRIARRLGRPIPAELCGKLMASHPYVRTNALIALATDATCSDASIRRRLEHDPSWSVRIAAAAVLAARISAQPTAPESSLDRRALRRCADEDHDATVADRCASPASTPSTTGGGSVSVYVVGASGGAPQPGAPFSLARPDGYLRLGYADRRGSLFEASEGDGKLELRVPAPLVRDD